MSKQMADGAVVSRVARWDALDVFRGLAIMLMLLNLSPGSWEFNYSWLTHATWEGGTLVDMVAPAFLFSIGCAMPLSFVRRAAKGATRGQLLSHVASRSILLIAIGLFLNLYPDFDWPTVRIPGVLQRIGLCYGVTGAFVLLAGHVVAPNALAFRPRAIAIALLAIVAPYWLLLYAVPAPGFGAPRFDPVASWPPVVDRAVIGVPHMFKWWPVDGCVVFDPEGILSTWPACANVMFGVLIGLAYARGGFRHPTLTAIALGAALMGLALATRGICPIIKNKNLWTSTFILFSGGFSLAALGLLMSLVKLPALALPLAPARIFGENPLLAYILCFLAMPLVDHGWFGSAGARRSLRAAGQARFSGFVEPRAASLAFGLCGLAALFASSSRATGAVGFSSFDARARPGAENHGGC